MVKKQDAKIFEAYKPLHNVIRKLGLTDFLAVIRATYATSSLIMTFRLIMRFILNTFLVSLILKEPG
ncbi:MAG: hypothetical protein A4E19_15510 [Nitrospira sp. SG-bin1]|nr:MAG: hypothetical protein A4E19_15510 [Nitrospira sp. SG-bin1]